MAGSQPPGTTCLTLKTPNSDAGTSTRSRTPHPHPGGCSPASTAKRKVNVLALDGDKVKDFLFHVAAVEVQWLDLMKDPEGDPVPSEQKQRAHDRATMLYDEFLDACHQGPNYATAFLASQHDCLKKYASESQKIYQKLGAEIEKRNKRLAEVAFGAQFVKSAATVGVGIIGVCLTGPAIVTGAGIALGFDLIIEGINHFGHSSETNANTVVVGFKQTIANDSVSVAGGVRQVSQEGTASALEQTLSFPKKSSTFRSAVSEAGQIDKLLKSLGWLSLGVTVYQEGNSVYSSYKEMNGQ
jgi:hypothetical protein